MRAQRGWRETRLEERLEPGKDKFSRSRVWYTMSDSAERSAKGRTETSHWIWKDTMFSKRDLIRVMGEDIIWEKLQSVGGENLKLMST